MFPERGKLFFVGAQFFRAVLAAKVFIRPFTEPFGMPVKGDLPADQQSYRQREKAPGIGLLNEEQRREHHSIVPIIDAAGAAALVFHE